MKARRKEFKEIQKFTQWWLWVLLIGATILPFALGIYHDVSYTLAKGILVGASLLLPLSLFAILRLDTKINAQEIQVRFFPFVNKKVKIGEIKKLEVLDYGFVGGWGIRLWTKYGTVYNTKGRKGLAVELKSGKKFLVGTQKAEELRSFVEQLSIK